MLPSRLLLSSGQWDSGTVGQWGNDATRHWGLHGNIPAVNVNNEIEYEHPWLRMEHCAFEPLIHGVTKNFQNVTKEKKNTFLFMQKTQKNMDEGKYKCNVNM